MAIKHRFFLVSALALSSALALTGCSVGVNGAADGAAGGPMPIPGVMQHSTIDFDAAASEMASAPGLPDQAAVDRSVIVTGWSTVLVEDPEAAATTATDIVAAAGGRVDSRSVQSPTDYSGGSATLTLRIPADDLEAVLAELGELGQLQQISTNASDVTVEVQDLDARIGALRDSIERLTDLQREADGIDALIQLETALSDRQGQLESLEAQQRYYDDQIAMSTVTVDFVTEPVVDEPAPGSFWDGVVKGWEALGAFLAGALVAVGVALPWLIPIVVIVAVIWIIVAVSRATKRRRAAAVSSDGTPTQPPAPSAAP